VRACVEATIGVESDTFRVYSTPPFSVHNNKIIHTEQEHITITELRDRIRTSWGPDSVIGGKSFRRDVKIKMEATFTNILISL